MQTPTFNTTTIHGNFTRQSRPDDSEEDDNNEFLQDIANARKCAYNRTRFLQGCSYILRGSLAEIQTFGSRGTIISPIRILMYDFGAPMQTIDIIRQVTLVRELFRKIG